MKERKSQAKHQKEMGLGEEDGEEGRKEIRENFLSFLTEVNDLVNETHTLTSWSFRM